MTVWAVVDKDGQVLVLVRQAEVARKLAEAAPGATVQEMAVLDG